MLGYNVTQLIFLIPKKSKKNNVHQNGTKEHINMLHKNTAKKAMHSNYHKMLSKSVYLEQNAIIYHTQTENTNTVQQISSDPSQISKYCTAFMEQTVLSQGPQK